jgi:hypothetical protein
LEWRGFIPAQWAVLRQTLHARISYHVEAVLERKSGKDTDPKIGQSSSGDSYLAAGFDAEHLEFGILFRGGGDRAVR